jgi:sporulation protein YlmC with PRC-barrel domain
MKDPGNLRPLRERIGPSGVLVTRRTSPGASTMETAMQNLETTHTPLIPANKVAGTEVYNTAGDHLGEIQDVILDKSSGKVAYAIMSFGGFLGLNEKYHPLPWDVLTYDTDKGGYRVDLTKDQLENAPNYGENGEPDWADREYGKHVHDYYGSSPTWMM